MAARNTSTKTLLFFEEHRAFEALEFSPAYHSRAAHFLSSILKETAIYNWSPLDYVPRARNWFHTVYNDKGYHRWLHPMLDIGLIERDDYQRPTLRNQGGQWLKTANGKCYGYRLHPELTGEALRWLDYSDRWQRKKEKEKARFDGRELCAYTRDTLRQLRTPLRANQVDTFTENYVSPEWIRAGLFVDEEILDNVVQWRGCYWKLDQLITEAHKVGKSVIKDGRRIEVEPLAYYIRAKRRNCIVAYAETITNLKNRKVYALEDETTGRIHSNFTTLPASRKIQKSGRTYKQPGIAEFFRIDGEKLTSFDFVSWQFTLALEVYFQTLEYIIEKFNLSIQNCGRNNIRELLKEGKGGMLEEEEGMLVTSHTLLCDIFEHEPAASYLKSAICEFSKLVPTKGARFDQLDFHSLTATILENHTGKKITRGTAKKVGFELLFSAWNNYSELKAALKAELPLFVAWVDTFKRTMIERYAYMEKDEPEAFKRLIEQRSKNRAARGKDTTAETLGNAAFVVTLQRLESAITHKILAASKAAGLKVLSKHDSYVTRSSDAEKLEKIIIEASGPYFHYQRPWLRKEEFNASVRDYLK